ncbi:MAG: choice-of-anchor D domain-containing protein [Myxococcales bacterium]|nr:choice-of-anchor D domain-containing protein [Myxococcales bacterium]
MAQFSRSLPGNALLPLMLLSGGCGSVGLDANTVFDGKGMATVAPDGMIEFEARPVGQGTSEQFSIDSVGDIPITVEDAWVEVPDPNVFFVGALPFPKSLAPGESFEFQVNFEPQQNGIFYGTLMVAMDDGSTLERNVTGTGCGDDNHDGECG